MEVGLRTEVVVAGGVVVDVVDTEEEGIDHRPLEPEGEGVLDQVLGVGHVLHGNCHTLVVGSE